MKLPDQLDGYALSLVLAFLGSTWIALLLVRVTIAPVRLYSLLLDKIPPQKRSDISIALNKGAGVELYSNEHRLGMLGPNYAYQVHIINIGELFLEKCQILLSIVGKTNYHEVSGYFDLRRGEHRDVTIIRCPVPGGPNPDTRPFLYFLKQPSGEIDDGSAVLLHPGAYEVLALSAGTAPATLTVRVVKDEGNHWSITDATP